MFLYLVRHGQSGSQAGAKISDPHLSTLGREQARRAAAFLTGGVQVSPKVRGPQPDIVICSPLRRALETAHILADSFDVPPVLVRHDLHEHGGRRPECLVRGTIHTEFPGVVCDPSMPDGPWWPAEDEPEEASFARGARVASWLRERYTEFEGGIAVVTHSTSGHHLICSLVGHTALSTIGFAQNNCGISIFHITNEFTRCWTSNSTAHLERQMVT